MAAKKSQPAVFTLMEAATLLASHLGPCKCKNVWKQLLSITYPRVLVKFNFNYQLAGFSSTQSH